MNELNYASVEASKKLVDTGIMLETEAVWRKKRDKTGYYLTWKKLYHRTSDIPAPTMAEVWRELPEETVCKKQYDETKCTNVSTYDLKVFFNSNPTDALIDLLIWVRKEKI